MVATTGGLGTYWKKRSARRGPHLLDRVPDVDLTARGEQLGKDVSRAGRATARGVNAGLSAAWDVAMGGADVVRTKAKVLPTLTEAAGEAGSSLGSAAGKATGAATSFVGATMKTVMWLSLIGSALILIYLPDPKQRDRFFARMRGYADSARGVADSGGRQAA